MYLRSPNSATMSAAPGAEMRVFFIALVNLMVAAGDSPT